MIFPRSSSHERLEGGMGPNRTPHFRWWFGWKKFGILAMLACILIGLIYLLGPRQHRWSPQDKQPGRGLSFAIQTGISDPPATGHLSAHDTPPAPIHDAKPVVPTTHPESYETDPDPMKTTYCTSPHSPGDPPSAICTYDRRLIYWVSYSHLQVQPLWSIAGIRI